MRALVFGLLMVCPACFPMRATVRRPQALCAQATYDLFRRASEVLLRTGQLSVSAFVRTSLNLLDISGSETEELAADTLLQCDSANEARSTLDDIIKNGSLERPQWAKKVLRQLEGAG